MHFKIEFTKVNEDDRRFWINVGAGPGFLKAGQAYDLKPLFLTKAGLGWQVFASPYYMVSNRFNVGLKVGGIFAPLSKMQNQTASFSKNSLLTVFSMQIIIFLLLTEF